MTGDAVVQNAAASAGGYATVVVHAQSPAQSPPGVAGRRRSLCWLPLVSGGVVLVLCWTAMAVALVLNGGASCLPEPGFRAVADHVAFQLKIWDESGVGSAVALVIYATVCVLPYALLSGCVLLAARGRSTLFLAVLAISGIAFMALYDVLGFWAAYNDLSHGGFLCGFAFDLMPVGGLIAGACAATAGCLAALLIEWRWRAGTGTGAR
ncbi:MAG TPA: hypothetical protein VKU84_09590 [Stellaceae bacterium]|nr:hypothetical protein [Stellaceae bacterium]